MYDKLFINGQWVAPLSGKTFPVENPATEEVFHHIAAAGPEDANAAVNAAYAALKEWKKLTGAQRAVYLRNFAAKVQEKAKELARLETMDCGKPVAEAAWDMDDVAGCFTYYAELAEQLDGRQGELIKVPLDTFETRLFYEAAGVVTLIVPWNYPLLMAAWKVAPALAAGCTIVLKPSEFTSLTSLELAAIANEVGLPAGVFNVVTGTGADVGEPLTKHEKVAKIAFTGSTATGRRIMASASAGLKGISLELGGKSPLLIFADSVTKADGSIDADEIDKVAEWVMFGCFWTNGQICSATSRLLVEESVAEPLLARVKILSEHWIKIGDPLLDDTKLGPLVNRQQYEKVLGYVELGKEQGATLLMGGKRPASQARGYFVEPTVFTNVRRDMRIWREEIFGPVLSVMTFKTEEEAVALANDSDYGLGSGVISKDADRCARIVRAMEAGIVWVNCSQPCFCQGPWGGVKLSGIGRDLGTYGLDKFLEVKQVTTYKSSDAWGWYVKSKL